MPERRRTSLYGEGAECQSRRVESCWPSGSQDLAFREIDLLSLKRSKRQPVPLGGTGLSLTQPIFALLSARTFATGCAHSVPQLFHPNRPETGSS
jgi:hypothetical protein